MKFENFRISFVITINNYYYDIIITIMYSLKYSRTTSYFHLYVQCAFQFRCHLTL